MTSSKALGYCVLASFGLGFAYFAGFKSSHASVAPASAPPKLTASISPQLRELVLPTESAIRHAAGLWLSHWVDLARNGNFRPTHVIYARSFKFSNDVADATADFLNSHGDVHGTIKKIHGPLADVSVSYGLPTSSNGSLRFSIDGEIHFIHGRDGWLDDHEWWTNRTIVGYRAPNGSVSNFTNSKIVGDESIQFESDGARYRWTRGSKGWTVAAVATPIPFASTPSTVQTEAPGDTATQTDQPASTAGSGYPSEPAPAPAYARTDCEEADVTAVYDDGKVLELDDGRHLRVDDSDTSTSAVWVAPFDGLLCNGDHFINKDDDESVDLGP